MRRNGAETNGSAVRAFLVDDHPIVVDGLRRLVDGVDDVELVGSAADVEEALDALDDADADVVVTELTLAGAGGFGLIRAIRSRAEAPRVVVLSRLDLGTYVQRALEAGAHGFVAKTDAPEEIVRAIKAAHRGERYVSEGLADAVDVRPQSDADDDGDAFARLSNREVEVLRLIGEGRGTREIARLLERSIKTIEAHREHIKQKLGLRDGSALLQRAIQFVWER